MRITLTGIAAGLHALAILPRTATETDIEAVAQAHCVALGCLSERTQLSPTRQGVMIGYGRPSDHADTSALDALTTTFAERFGQQGTA
ncbi:hypothetical protein [Kribbella sp. NPDC049227]|uniref:hypothetical protein n=1 Tax=Kribbella sp. NPDC049227 TaxID=3364113 RepID=UPI003724801F